MKNLLFFLLIHLSLIVSAQNVAECEYLSLEVAGIINKDHTNQLVIECSNAKYEGNLYYYPGFILFNEKGDTIAKENVNYYGIGPNFQNHLLEIKNKIEFPFTGYLALYGNKLKKEFCSFPIEFEELPYLTDQELNEKTVKVNSTINDEFLVIDLGDYNINAEKTKYYISLTNDENIIVYETKTDLSVVTISMEKLEKDGSYVISIWDAVQERLLPAVSFDIIE